jgi:hypothetical protein
MGTLFFFFYFSCYALWVVFFVVGVLLICLFYMGSSHRW